ncbi:hypothetical protein MKX08_003201 [Trichoderma sp. CBMAI-0020]|nr:hypothetical protein MKX08_003201 [Trichoderma sp. CBMAI-0020]
MNRNLEESLRSINLISLTETPLNYANSNIIYTCTLRTRMEGPAADWFSVILKDKKNNAYD